MKHFMVPKSASLREMNPFSELTTSPNKPKSNRKPKHQSKDKENANPNPNPIVIDAFAGKSLPSPAKIRSPLPPRPPLCNPLKRKLNDAVSDGIGLGATSSSLLLDSGVKVVVRMRPSKRDVEDGERIVQKMSNDSLSINGHTFTYDSVADTDSTQIEIFQLVGAPLVENCLAGFNSSVFAYGQTGSGKTYTMWGPANALQEENLANEQQGLTPRVFERLFARIKTEQIKHEDKQLRYRCRCSFLEIYNEQITDLLDPTQKNLQIREDVKSGVYVENLTEECVSTVNDVIRLLAKGLSHRRTGVTSVNAESSRSHSVFTCVVASQCKRVADGLSSFKTSRINLVDLAGSERQKLTGAAGERLKEAGNINRSLSQLGNLINILAEVSQTGKQRHIPYRDSRLTFLLQDSLGGNAKLAMICAVSPSQSCRSETFSTLRFAQRAKAIKNKAVVNEVMQDDVNALREVIKQLKDELQRMKAHGNQNDPKAAYANSWNARRSLSLLKFSLNHPMALSHLDGDGDIEMEVVEELCKKGCLESNAIGLEKEEMTPEVAPLNGCIEHQNSEVSDVSMEEGISEIDNADEIIEKLEEVVNETPSKAIEDGSVIPCDISPLIVPSPAPSISPTLSVTNSRKSLKTSSMITASASQRDVQRRSTTQHLAASLQRGLEIIESQRQSSAFRTSPLRFSFKPLEPKTNLPVSKVDVGIQTSLENADVPEEDDGNYLCSNCKTRVCDGDSKEANEHSELQLVPVDRSHSAEKPKNQVPKAVEKVLAGAIRREMALEEFCAKQNHEIAHLNRLVQQYKHERDCNAIISQMREDKIIRLESLMDGVLPSEDFMEEELICLHKEHEILKEKYDNHPEVLETRIELTRAQDELERLRNFFDMGEKEVLVEEIHDLRSQLQYYTECSPKSNRQQKSFLKLTYPIAEITEENGEEKLKQERNKWREVETHWITLAEDLKLRLESSSSLVKQLECELESEKRCSDELKEAMKLAMQGHARMLEQYADLEEKHMQMLARHRKMQEGIEDVKKAASKAGVKGAESKFINTLAAQISALRVEKERERRYLRDENKMLQSQLRDTAEAVQAAGELLVRLKEAEEAIAAAEMRAEKAEEETKEISKLIEKLNKNHETEIYKLNQVIAKSQLPDHAPDLAKYDAETRDSFDDVIAESKLPIDEPNSAKSDAETRDSFDDVIAECKVAVDEPNSAKYDAETRDSFDGVITECKLAVDEPNSENYDAEARDSLGDDQWKEEFEVFDIGVDNDLLPKLPEPSSWFSGYDRCNI